ncbi:MAG: PHP domain-containing protein [Candidatus Izemoplasma sp.]|nr:PHP domain-containing protein [Candidatus Izemoplasma sp.]
MKCYYDLHIHSVLSPDGDEFMTPNNILNMAMLKNLDFIAITDHNCLLQLQTVKNIETSYDFIFVPGVEVTVKEGFDVLCYFRTFNDAEIFNQFIQGYLTDTFTHFTPDDQIITDIYDNPIGTVKKGLLTSTLPYKVLYRQVKSLDGIALFAHINRPSKSVLNNYSLDDYLFDGIEIEPQHKTAFLKKYPQYKQYITLSNSDSHTLMSISERIEYLELAEKSIDAFFDYFKGGTKNE